MATRSIGNTGNAVLNPDGDIVITEQGGLRVGGLNVPTLNAAGTALLDGNGNRLPLPFILAQFAIARILQQSSFVGNNGALTLGSQIGGGTATFGATSGSTTVTLSVAGLLGTSSDNGRVITVDGGKKFTITAFSSTTVATGTISGGTLSSVGPFATWQLAWPFPTNGVYPQPMYTYFPAGAVFPASPAGWYYTVMSDNTTGTIFADTYSGPGVSTIPASPTPLVTTGPGAFTQTTGSAITTASAILPGGLLGPNGALRYESCVFANQFGTGTRSLQTAFGGALSGTGVLLGTGGVTFARQDQTYANMGAVNRQLVHHPAASANSGTGNNPTQTNVNTAVDQLVANQLQLAVATDYIGQYWLRLTVYPRA